MLFPKRAFILQFLSVLFPTLFVSRIFIALFSSLSVFALSEIEEKIISKESLFMTLFISFNPMFLKLSSMYLTDSVFFTLIVFFFLLKLKGKEFEAIALACFSTFVRFEGFLLIFINILDLLLKRDLKTAFVQALFSIFLIPVLFFGLNLYFTLHLGVKNPEAPYWYYFITPFLIVGIFSLLLPYSIIKQIGKILVLDFIFFFFTLFYFFSHAGGTFSDRFRYVLPTILPSAFYIAKTFEIFPRKAKNIFMVMLLLNLLLLVPLYSYRSFREDLKFFMRRIV